MNRFGLFICVTFGFFIGTLPVMAAPIVSGSFSTTWDTGSDLDVSINLGNCASSVYWEEIGNPGNNGTTSNCIGGNINEVTFTSPGQYRVDYSGPLYSIYIIDQPNRDRFRTVEQWGDSQWSGLSNAFSEVYDLVFNATDVPDLSQTTVMSVMFNNATNFNSDISNWDVSNVTDMWGMFNNATAFNQPLNNWDVSNVTDMWRTFENASSFNRPLNNWNVSNVTDMNDMFNGATAFNQSISNWDISNNPSLDNIFIGTALSAENYSSILTNWSALTVQSDVYFGVSAQYCDTAQAARDILTTTYSWIITDGGVTTECVGEVAEVPSGGSSGTRVSDRKSSYFYSPTATTTDQITTLVVATKVSFLEGVRSLLDYLTKNEAELANLSAAESTKLIIGLRDILTFLLTLLPGV